MAEWILKLDSDLQFINAVLRLDDDDARNGPLGVMFIKDSSGCVYDRWTSTLDPMAVAWVPRGRNHNFCNERHRYPNSFMNFYTNATDELDAFANLQKWLAENKGA